MNDLQQIYQRLGGINQGVKGINDHLAKLNSKVAKHEDRLNYMDVDDAKVKSVIDALTDKHTSSETTKDKIGWYLFQAAFTAVCVIAVLLLTRTGILDLQKEPDTKSEVQKQLIELRGELQKLQVQTDDINHS